MIADFAQRSVRKGIAARFFLFGSRVRGDCHERSDFDLAVDGGRPLDPLTLALLRDDLEGLPTLYRIDLVDAATLSPEFRTEAFSDIEVLV